MPFVKGQSGNPAGRPLGARNKETLAIEARFEARAEEIVDVAVGKAVLGHTPALRMCLDRILPRRRDRPVPFVLPPMAGAAATERAIEDIKAAVGTGELTIAEALGLLQIVEKSARIVAAARAGQHAGARETVTPLEPAEPSVAEPGGDRQTTEETMKYNEPLEPVNGAAEPGPDVRAVQDGAASHRPPIGERREAGEPAGMTAASTDLAAGVSPSPDRADGHSASALQQEVRSGAALALGKDDSPPARIGQQPAEETMKYNGRPGSMNHAGAPQPCEKRERTQKTTKYNGPPGLLDGVAHFIRPAAHQAPPIAPSASVAPPKLSTAA